MTAVREPDHRAGLARLSPRQRSIIAVASRYLGGLAVLVTGVDHIEQYAVDNYSTVPTIGTLFLLNFIAAIVIAVGLIAPLRPLVGRYADTLRALIAVAGIGLGVLSLAGLFVSEGSGLFGFVEHGYRMAIVVAIVGRRSSSQWCAGSRAKPTPLNVGATNAMLTSILQPTHLLVILAVALLVLGPKRLPEAGRALGQGLKEFRSSISSSHDDEPPNQISAIPRDTTEKGS